MPTTLRSRSIPCPRFGGFRAARRSLWTTRRAWSSICRTADRHHASFPGAARPGRAASASVTYRPRWPARLRNPNHRNRSRPRRRRRGRARRGGDERKGYGARHCAPRQSRASRRRLGVRVLLTRDDDRNVPLDDRTALANNNKADLFISHPRERLRPAEAPQARRLFSPPSMTANRPKRPAPGIPSASRAFGGGLRDIEMVPWNLAQTRHLGQSTAFAETLRAAAAGQARARGPPHRSGAPSHPRIGQHAGGSDRNRVF